MHTLFVRARVCAAGMLGLGAVVCFTEGGAYDLRDVSGSEVVSLGGRAGGVVTLSNGICASPSPTPHALDGLMPPELDSLARGVGITHMAHGLHHGVAVTLLGAVYTWGVNVEGQLGRLPAASSAQPPAQVTKLAARHIVSVAAGDSHTLALTGAC
ncbi:hypothetical protein EON67_04430 [archaeon]|nr:MAG: hypothetical protein EON67_04430 [archaeon]